MKGDSAEIIDAVTRLVQALVASFGATGTVLIALGVVLAAFGFLYYQHWRKSRETNAVIQAKDQTIQRLAEQERSLRIVLFRQLTGWSQEEVERVVVKNEFPDVVSARKALEGEQPQGTQPIATESKRRRKERK